MIKEMKTDAFAKINLGLDVLRRREDGYHELRMIMQTIALHDTISLELTGESGIRVRTDRGELPTDRGNLVYRAAELLLSEFAPETGVFIDLKKNIPVAAGLAGGSSDAAAVLRGLNRMLDLGLSTEELMRRGVKIGADVPYCILQGTALAEGIGERLTPLPPAPPWAVLLVKPPAHVSTKEVYQQLRVGEITEHPDIDGQIAALKNRDLDALASLLGNVLESVTIPLCPVIREIRDDLLQAGAAGALMSGSGPTVFGLFREEKTAEDACRRLQADKKNFVCLTKFYPGA